MRPQLFNLLASEPSNPTAVRAGQRREGTAIVDGTQVNVGLAHRITSDVPMIIGIGLQAWLIRREQAALREATDEATQESVARGRRRL